MEVQKIDLSTHDKATLYKYTIEEVKAHFLTVGYGEGQAIKRDLVKQYLDLYPSNIESVLLYSDGIKLTTNNVSIMIGNHLKLSVIENKEGFTDKHMTIIANQFLHQLSLMFALYNSRLWISSRDKVSTERLFGALDELNGKRFI